MSAVDDLVIGPIEGGLDKLGMMRGRTAALKRTALGAGIGAAVVYGIKPKIMFTDSGKPRPWSVFSDSADATLFPYWMGIALPAAFLGVFI